MLAPASPNQVRVALLDMGCDPDDMARIMRCVSSRPLRSALVLRKAKRMALPHVDLPAPPFRWGASRKAAVVEAVRNGQITFGDACARFDITADELIEWFARAAIGPRALRATKRPGARA